MDDLQTLRKFRAQVTPSERGLSPQRERLLAEIKCTPRRFGRLRGLRHCAHGLWVPALAGSLTVVLLLGVLGVVLVQSQRSDLAGMLESDQWTYTRTVEVSNPGQGQKTVQTWVRGDFAVAVRSEGDGEPTTRRNGVRQSYLGYFDSRQDLYDLYQTLMDHPDSRLATLNARLDKIAKEQDMTPDNTPERVYRAARLHWAFLLVRDALSAAAPPREVQEALYQTYRRYAGVENDGNVNDAAGRASVALGVPTPGLAELEDPEQPIERLPRAQLLFDPDTHAYQGWRAVAAGGTTSMALVSTGIVDESGDVP